MEFTKYAETLGIPTVVVLFITTHEHEWHPFLQVCGGFDFNWFYGLASAYIVIFGGGPFFYLLGSVFVFVVFRCCVK